MQQKEVVYVCIGAFLLTNASVLATLYMTGYWRGQEPSVVDEKVEVIEGEKLDAAALIPGELTWPQSRANFIHSVAEAAYVCEDKLDEASAGVAKSYAVDTVASRYDTEGDIYKIFIDFETPSRAEKPKQQARIVCDVSAESRAVVSYTVMAK